MDDRVPERRDSHASSSHGPSLEPTRTRSVDLGKHSVFTHFPKDRNCEICQRTKITRAPCRRRMGGAVPRAENFGDLITADHIVKVVHLETIIDMQSFCRTWPPMDPVVSVQNKKLLKEHKGACKSSWSRIGSQKSFTLTIPWNVAKLVKIFHCTSTPYRSETNGIPERAVRKVKEGTSAVLLQSGLDENWWADSMECYTYLRNVQDLLSDGKTPYERRFGEPFKGPIVPFGSLVEYYPISAKEKSRIHQFGKKVLPGLFLGYALYAGGIWKGDILVADIEELEQMDASEIYLKRLNAKEVIFPKENGNFIFPADESHFLEEIRN